MYYHKDLHKEPTMILCTKEELSVDVSIIAELKNSFVHLPDHEKFLLRR